MSVVPQIVFTRFDRSDSPKLRPWVQHFERVAGRSPVIEPSASGDAESGATVVWHLVSGNNRVLGRGGRVHSSFAAAVVSANDAVSRIEQAVAVPVSDGQRGEYGWFVAVDDEVLLTCSRWYLTERDRRKSLAVAMASLPIAEVQSGSRLIDPNLRGDVSRSISDRGRGTALGGAAATMSAEAALGASLRSLAARIEPSISGIRGLSSRSSTARRV